VMAGGAALIAVGGGAAHRELDQGGVEVRAHHEHHERHEHATVKMASPAAQVRMLRAFDDLGATRVGVAKRIATRAIDGLLYTDVEVTSPDGERVQLSLPGGELDGIGQIVGHGRLPADGDELMVEPATKRFAFHLSGIVWGGALGDGPAIELQ
jgi:hypothetical protein